MSQMLRQRSVIFCMLLLKWFIFVFLIASLSKLVYDSSWFKYHVSSLWFPCQNWFPIILGSWSVTLKNSSLHGTAKRRQITTFTQFVTFIKKYTQVTFFYTYFVNMKGKTIYQTANWIAINQMFFSFPSWHHIL